MKNVTKIWGIFTVLVAVSLIAYVLIANPFSTEITERTTEVTDSDTEVTEVAVEVSDVGIDVIEEVDVDDDIDDVEDPEEALDTVIGTFQVDGTPYKFKIEEGSTAIDLMRQLSQDEDDFNFVGTESDYGFFVEEINGVANDSANSEYWSLYVNDALANVGASDYVVQDGDKIEWRFEHISF